MSEVIYHYTDLGGKVGIYDNKTLRIKLTSASRNDEEDTTYIKSIVKELYEERKRYDEFTAYFLHMMNSVLNPKGKEKEKDFLNNNVFMFCVMENQNDYGGRSLHYNDTDVYRIEFDRIELTKAFERYRKSDMYFDFEKANVIYHKDKQREYLLSIIKKFIPLDYIPTINNYVAATPTTDYSFLDIGLFIDKEPLSTYKIQANKAVALANELYRKASLIKNIKYEEEQEFRFSFYRKQGEEYKPLEPLVKPPKERAYFVINISEECLVKCVPVGKGMLERKN